MTISPIETIKREAEEAAEKGQSRDFSCRWPHASIEGVKFRKFYDAANGPYLHALASYRAAIAADAA